MRRFLSNFLGAARKTGNGLLVAVAVLASFLVLRALFASPLAEAATNTYYPGYCLGGWDNPNAAAGKPGKSEPHGAPSAAYLAPDVFAQIFCGYFPVTSREKPPKGATVTFNFSLSGDVPAEEAEDQPQEEEPKEEKETEEPPRDEPQDEGGTGGDSSPEDSPPDTEESPTEPSQEDAGDASSEGESTSSEDSSGEESSSQGGGGDGGGESSGETSFINFLLPRARAEDAAENLLVVSYSFDGVRWYAAGRMTRENAHSFSMRIPASMWSDLQNLQVMAAPLPVSGERPDIFLESIELAVEADLTIAEMAADGAAAVGGVIGEVLGVVDALPEAAMEMIAPKPIMEPNLPPPPVKKKALFFEPAGEAVAVEGSGKAPPRVDISADGLTLRVDGECAAPYYVILTYRSIEDFVERPRSFVSNYAGECRGADFHTAMKHLPVDTEPGVYYLLVAKQEATGSWEPVSSLLPIRMTETEIVETTE